MKFTVTDEHIQGHLPFGDLHISRDEKEGYRPFQLMIASLAGCSGFVFRRMLAKQRVEYEEMTIEADVKRSGDEIDRIEKVKLTFKVKGKDLNKKKLQKSLEIASK